MTKELDTENLDNPIKPETIDHELARFIVQALRDERTIERPDMVIAISRLYQTLRGF